MANSRKELTERWNKVKPRPGRLYWRAHHKGWRWDTDEIARVIDRPFVTHYTSIDALIQEIEAAEAETVDGLKAKLELAEKTIEILHGQLERQAALNNDGVS